MEKKTSASKDYGYLLSLRRTNEIDGQVIEIIKEKDNIKDYIVQAILSFEHGKRTVQEDVEFRKSLSDIEVKLRRMEETLENINRNTGL